uniref:Uncharacterized protein n=1 Tax=Oryza sativa subsp. japonica TaxID=39947 RepID=Q7X859_ORYSJ|nr:hypothetical protein [Oryza sativa Japonica Group]BAC79861.1 hypothetical protein [Oryza sativa Japonica Group]
MEASRRPGPGSVATRHMRPGHATAAINARGNAEEAEAGPGRGRPQYTRSTPSLK